jgi:hypothetical protein
MTEESMDWEMYRKILKNCEELGIRKNREYGTASLKLFDGLAIVTRINDKTARLNNLFKNHMEIPGPDLDNAIDDTLEDMINYAIYLMMLRHGGIK